MYLYIYIYIYSDLDNRKMFQNSGNLGCFLLTFDKMKPLKYLFLLSDADLVYF